MKAPRSLIVLFGLLATVSLGHATDNPAKKDLAPLLKADEYSLKFQGDREQPLAPSAPSGLSNLSRENNKPFLGLSLTRPLSK